MFKQERIFRLMLTALLVFGFTFNLSAEGQKEEGAVEKQTLSFITWRGDDSEGYDAIIKAFEEKYPNITVNAEYFAGGSTYDSIVTTRGMGGELDFYAAQPGGQVAAFVQSGFAMDLSDQEFLKRSTPGSLAAASYDGKTYGVAQAMSTICVFYNKEIFKQYGLDIPKTWDEFINICDTLKSDGVTPLAAGLSQYYIGQNIYKMMAADLDPEGSVDLWRKVVDGEMTLRDEPFPTIFNAMGDLFNKGYYVDGVEGIDKHGAASLFAQGKVAMDIEGTWRTSTISAAEGAPDFGIFSLPFTGDPERMVHIIHPNQAHFIFPGSKHIDAALKFYDFMQTPEMAAVFSNKSSQIPTVIGTEVDSADLQIGMSLINSTEGVLGPNLALTNMEIQQALYDSFAKVAMGLDVDEVIEEQQAKIDAVER